MATKEASATTIITGKVRLSYTYLLEPDKNEDGSNGKYRTMFLIPKSDKDTLAKIEAAQKAAAKEGASILGKIPPSGFNPAWSTLHDGDEDQDTDEKPEYKGMMYLNVSTTRKPGIIDRQGNHLTSEDDVYPGMWAKLQIKAAAYNVDKKKGVTFYLNHVQKIADDENLMGRSKPEDVFEILDDDDDEDAGDLI